MLISVDWTVQQAAMEIETIARTRLSDDQFLLMQAKLAHLLARHRLSGEEQFRVVSRILSQALSTQSQKSAVDSQIACLCIVWLAATAPYEMSVMSIRSACQLNQRTQARTFE